MTINDIKLERVNYLLSLKLSDTNLVKRTCRAKKGGKYEEYLALRLVKAHQDFVKSVENEDTKGVEFNG